MAVAPGFPLLPPELSRVLAAARQNAVRAGHGSITPWHLVQVLAREHPDVVRQVLGEAIVSEAALQLSLQQRSFVDPTPSEGTLQALTAAAPASDPVAALAALLRQVAAVPGMTPGGRPSQLNAAGSAPAGGRLGLSAIREQFAHVVTPASDLVSRPSDVDAVVGALTAARTPLVVAPEGSGRTTMADLLAARLQDPSYDGPLRGRAVVLVRAADVVAVETGPAIQGLLTEVDGRAVVVLDDLEVLSGLGGGSRLDAGLLAVVRSAVHGTRRPLVLLLAQPWEQALRAEERELVEECITVPLSPLPDAAIFAIAAGRATRLAESQRVVMGEDAVRAAVGPAIAADTDAHPGLAVRRLEHAAAMVSLRSDRVVVPLDVVSPPQLPRFDATSFRAGLGTLIVGQDPVLDSVTGRLSLTRPELDLRPTRPDAVWLFAGPTGTGKTALAEAIAKGLFGSSDSMVRLDMSEYSEPQTVAKLVGSPPGYVGSTDPSSWLTTKILARPDCVLLLDEIEKADPVVWNTFLQVFDAGRLSDGLGRTADFRRVVVALTTNIGARVFDGRDSTTISDAASDQAAVLAAIKERMAPELVNRLDDVLVFAPLSFAAINQIAHRLVADVVRRMAGRGFVLTVEDAAVDLVVADGYDPAFGARPLQRSLERLLVQPLATLAPGAWRATVSGSPAAITWVAA